jgi:integrase
MQEQPLRDLPDRLIPTSSPTFAGARAKSLQQKATGAVSTARRRGMGDVVSLKPKRGTARDQLLAMVQHQAQIQGKSVAQYLRELQAQAERNGQERGVPQAVAPRAPREKYTYLTKREVDLLFEQITDLRDRALFGTMYYFGLRASEVGRVLPVSMRDIPLGSNLQ